MKHFFSIVINHEYDMLDDNTRGISNDLAIVPASSNSIFTNNNRLLFRNQTGGLDCFIEDDESIKNETTNLFFWVVCINEDFYSYTDYPNQINFSNPYYYWSNFEENSALQTNDFCDLHPGQPTRKAIGCICISINNINASEKTEFTVDFKVRKTYWEYHIITNASQDGMFHKIIDTEFNANNERDFHSSSIKLWEFEQIENDNPNEIIFRSTIPLPYQKKAETRLELVWGPEQKTRFEEDQKMILPFANYTYKMVNKDNKELTPIYIHI